MDRPQVILQTPLAREPLVTDGTFPSSKFAVYFYEVVFECFVVDANEATAVVGAWKIFGVS